MERHVFTQPGQPVSRTRLHELAAGEPRWWLVVWRAGQHAPEIYVGPIGDPEIVVFLTAADANTWAAVFEGSRCPVGLPQAAPLVLPLGKVSEPLYFDAADQFAARAAELAATLATLATLAVVAAPEPPPVEPAPVEPAPAELVPIVIDDDSDTNPTDIPEGGLPLVDDTDLPEAAEPVEPATEHGDSPEESLPA